MAESKLKKDLDFALLCLKTTPNQKPNFVAVAQYLGIDHKTAYHRHWTMMKNTPDINVNTGTTNVAAPANPKKRTRKAKNDEDDDIVDVAANSNATTATATATTVAAPATPAPPKKRARKAKDDGVDEVVGHRVEGSATNKHTHKINEKAADEIPMRAKGKAKALDYYPNIVTPSKEENKE